MVKELIYIHFSIFGPNKKNEICIGTENLISTNKKEKKIRDFNLSTGSICMMHFLEVYPNYSHYTILSFDIVQTTSHQTWNLSINRKIPVDFNLTSGSIYMIHAQICHQTTNTTQSFKQTTMTKSDEINSSTTHK